MVRQLLCSLFFSLLVVSLHAQALHIHYNVYKDSVYYVQNGKSVPKPLVQKGNEVVLHVENYNNYLYDVAVDIDNQKIPISNGSTANLLGSLGGKDLSPLNFLFKGSDQLLGAFKFFPTLTGKSLVEGSGFTVTEEEKARQEKVARLKKLETDFNAAKDNLFALDSELKTMQEQVQQKVAAQRLQIFALEELNHIRYDPFLSPDQIKKLSAEYMERIFQEKDPNKIDLDQVLSVADAHADLPKSIQEYRNKTEKYATLTRNCERLMTEFALYDFPESNLAEFKTKAQSFVGAVKTKTQSYQENTAMLEAALPKVTPLDPKSVSALRTTYLELNNNSFSKTYRQSAAGEKITMKIKLTPAGGEQTAAAKSMELAPVEVSVYGGMRVRASVGLSFGSFFNRPQSFFVRDSTLQSSDKDAFVPVMTSFVHFYAPSRHALSVAGSFGVGFPFGGGENLQAISFFLGPSFMFGRSERIVLNTGLMGAKTEALSQGYQVGDYYNSSANLAPTTSVYTLGYYVGVSFNLSGGM